MPLTRDFKETVQARARRDPAFREGLLSEGVECLLAGDTDTGKVLLRDYINATIGCEELSALTSKPPKSLMRMFGRRATPTPETCSRSSAASRSMKASASRSRQSASPVPNTPTSPLHLNSL